MIAAIIANIPDWLTIIATGSAAIIGWGIIGKLLEDMGGK